MVGVSVSTLLDVSATAVGASVGAPPMLISSVLVGVVVSLGGVGVGVWSNTYTLSRFSFSSIMQYPSVTKPSRIPSALVIGR